MRIREPTKAHKCNPKRGYEKYPRFLIGNIIKLLRARVARS